MNICGRTDGPSRAGVHNGDHLRILFCSQVDRGSRWPERLAKRRRRRTKYMVVVGILASRNLITNLRTFGDDFRYRRTKTLVCSIFLSLGSNVNRKHGSGYFFSSMVGAKR